MTNSQNAAFLSNMAWEQDYNEHAASLFAKVRLGEFTGGLLGIYHSNHGVVWQWDLIKSLSNYFDLEKLILRLYGTLPDVKDSKEWLSGFYVVLNFAYNNGVRMIQFSNEPNNPANPESFDTYRERWLAVRNLLKDRYPECLCLNPGYVPNVDEGKWDALLEDVADIRAIHCKWEGDNWNNEIWGASYKAYSGKLVITEWGQTNYSYNRTENCRLWLEDLRKYPDVILACYFGVEMIGWYIENADNALLVSLASVKPIGGGTTMPVTLAEQFPSYFRDWVAAGGEAEESFKLYMQATGRIPATRQDFADMCDKQKSHDEEIKQVGLRLIPLV